MSEDKKSKPAQTSNAENQKQPIQTIIEKRGNLTSKPAPISVPPAAQFSVPVQSPEVSKPSNSSNSQSGGTESSNSGSGE